MDTVKILEVDMMGNAYLLKEILNKIDLEFKMPFEYFTGSYFGETGNGEKDTMNVAIKVGLSMVNSKCKIMGIEKIFYKTLKTNSYIIPEYREWNQHGN